MFKLIKRHDNKPFTRVKARVSEVVRKNKKGGCYRPMITPDDNISSK